MSTIQTLTFQSDDGELVVSAMQNWRIVYSDDATVSEIYAAEEFQKWFKQASQLALPIVTADENTGNNDGQITITSSDELDDEEIHITVEQKQILLSGGASRGVLYAVYQFLEELVGIRFLTADHTYVPDASNLKVPCGSYTYNPPFSFRWSYYRENANIPEFAAKRKVNTVTDDENLGGKTQQQLINHSFHVLVPYSTYGEEHPEYYALVDGKRDTNTHGGGPQAVRHKS